MRTSWLVFLAIVLSGAGLAAGAEPLRIVTTTSDLADIATRVSGDAGVVQCVCKGTEDPHFLNARPSYMFMARDADLWIRVGMELETGWEQPVLDGSRNADIRPGQPGHLDASAHVHRLDVPTGTISRALGDVHPSGNPHYWMDPYNLRQVAATVTERLTQLRPADAARFQANRDAFQRECDTRMFGADLVAALGGEALWAATQAGRLEALLDAHQAADRLGGWAAAMRPLRGQPVVTYHKSWTYFLDRFGLTLAMQLEPKPGVPPTAAHLAQVVERVKRDRIAIILQEPYYSRKAADFVAGQTGARVVVAAGSVGGTHDATSVFDVLDSLVRHLTQPG